MNFSEYTFLALFGDLYFITCTLKLLMLVFTVNCSSFLVLGTLYRLLFYFHVAFLYPLPRKSCGVNVVQKRKIPPWNRSRSPSPQTIISLRYQITNTDCFQCFFYLFFVDLWAYCDILYSFCSFKLQCAVWNIYFSIPEITEPKKCKARNHLLACGYQFIVLCKGEVGCPV